MTPRSGSRPRGPPEVTMHRPRGVFAGLATLDVIHRVDASPGPDEKVTALSQFVAAGGPAANAAVTFAALGGHAVLLTALGRSPIDRKSTRLNSSHVATSYAASCLKKKS